MEKNKNNGGNNPFYKIPNWVNDVDDLAEHLKLNGSSFNILKSLFGLSKPRHNGTDEERDIKKIIHYGIRLLLAKRRVPELEITKAEIIAELYNELTESDKKRFKKLIIK